MTVQEFLRKNENADFLHGRRITMRGDFDHPCWIMSRNKKLKDVRLTKKHIYLYV
jgi:hypothetical protein